MLEKTASSIEPCSGSLQRVFPSARSCLQTRRKLHTAFWRHGAAELELLDACRALVRAAPPGSMPDKHAKLAQLSQRPDPPPASALRLDFLYPSGTAALLRRPHPIHAVLDSAPRTRNHVSRLFTSAVPRRSEQASSLRAAPAESSGVGDAENNGAVAQENGEHDVDAAVLDTAGAQEEADYEQDVEFADPDELWERLGSKRKHAGAYDQIYHLYTKIDPKLRETFTNDVLLAISPSKRPIEIGRVIELFPRHRVDEWTEELVRVVIKAQLSLHNVTEAMSIFRAALERHGFSDALVYIVPYAFQLSSWEFLLEAWELYLNTMNGERRGLLKAPAPTNPEPAVEPTGPQNLAQESANTIQDAHFPPEPESADVAVKPEQLKVARPAPMGTPESLVEPEVSQPPDDAASEQRPASGFNYRMLAQTAGLQEKFRQLLEFPKRDADGGAHRIALIDSLLRHILRHSMDAFSSSDAIFMLGLVKDPLLYERFILLSIDKGRKKVASKAYGTYRKLRGVQMAPSVLSAMVGLFSPHNSSGMEMLLKDWYRAHGHPDQKAYRKFIDFYAGQGDVKSVMRLGEEYEKRFDIKIMDTPEFVTSLMEIYSVRGDPAGAERVMKEAAEKSGVSPPMAQLTTLLKAYGKAGEYGSAIDLFHSPAFRDARPDEPAFAAMMHMAGLRGDLQFTIELYHLARDRGIEPSMTMMQALVEAYCENDQFNEAEKLCARVTDGRDITGDHTLLWNTLIRQHGRRRDLTTVNRVLDYMSSQGIAYNQDTYAHLMMALLLARQAHHAMHLLRLAHHQGVFQPTADHYILLMAAFIFSKEPHMALKTNELMSEHKFPESAKRMAVVITALGRYRELPAEVRKGRPALKYLKKVLNAFYDALEKQDGDSPDSVRSVTNLYSKVLFVLTEFRELATVHQIIDLHNTRYPERGTRDTMPLQLLHNIMLADFYDKNYDRVKETWDLVLERSSKRYEPASAHLANSVPRDEAPATKPVLYSRRFRLTDPLKTMQRLYLEQRDAPALLALVDAVRRRGFELDGKNWNLHVQALTQLKQWRRAFAVAEEVLMPNWTGWARVRMEQGGKNDPPLEVRRQGRRPDRPRPNFHTLLYLAKEYMDLEQMALWSHEAGREFRYVNEKCPHVVRAVTTMVRSGDALEARVLDAPVDERGVSAAREMEEREEEEEGGGGGKAGRRKRQRKKKKEKEKEKAARERQEQDALSSQQDVWSEGGFLNVLNSKAAAAKEGKQDLSEEDIINALKG